MQESECWYGFGHYWKSEPVGFQFCLNNICVTVNWSFLHAHNVFANKANWKDSADLPVMIRKKYLYNTQNTHSLIGKRQSELTISLSNYHPSLNQASLYCFSDIEMSDPFSKTLCNSFIFNLYCIISEYNSGNGQSILNTANCICAVLRYRN